MSRRTFAVVVLIASVVGCHRKPPPPGPDAQSFVVQDFEASPSIAKWPKDHPGDVAISTEWKADGARSLRIDPGLMAHFKELDLDDWSAFQVLRIKVHNPGDQAISVGFELQDDHDEFYDRHRSAFGAAPGDTEIEIDLTGGLWRGEENAPYRGETKTPLDTSKITRVGFTNEGKNPIFVDRLELFKVKPIKAEGAFAFDFGRKGTQVMPQSTGVFDDTQFTAERGFGFVGDKPVGLSKAMSYPTPLLGDGLRFTSGFRVDLKGGDYVGWIAFERGGFWEDEASGYAHAELKVNGATVHAHDFSPRGPHFFFEDTEVTDLKELVDKVVFPEHQVARFKMKAATGANTFTVETKDPNGPPLRVAGLFLAPDTKEGNAFIDAQEDLQKKTIARTFAPQDRGRRGEGRVAPSPALVAEPVQPGEAMYPRDWPTSPTGAPLPTLSAVPGQTVTVDLGVYAKKPLKLTASGTDLDGPDHASVPVPRVSYGRYLPMRAQMVGGAWLEISHYRPEPTFDVGPDLARSVVFEYRVPDGAKPGSYVGMVRFEGDGEAIKVPVKVQVVDVALPDLPLPVGLLMNALPFGPSTLDDEDAWWKLQEELLDEQGRAGLGVVTGGSGLEYRARKTTDAYEFSGERALKYLALAKKHKMDRGVVPYGGFLPGLRHTRADAAAFARGFQKFEKDNGLPPHYVYAYDEPGTEGELKEALNKMAPFTKAGLRTLGFTSMREGDAKWSELVDATFAPALCIHTAEQVKALKDKGKHVWIYNNGLDRYGFGLAIWREAKLGVEGRLEWIGANTQGFAFNNLDGREPSKSAFLVHDKLGVLATPRWLAAREGLLDARIRFALEAAVPPGDPALAEWTLDGYRKDAAEWPDKRLATTRQKMLTRLEETRAKKK